MNRLDREIMKTILAEEQSIYSVNEALKKKGEETNYATVWRHIKKMKEDDLLNVADALRKNGKVDRRNTEILNLTNKGLATLLIEGDLQEKELSSIGQKFFQRYFSEKMLTLINPVMASIFSDALSKIKPKANLKYFDEKYFNELLVTSFLESFLEIIPKTNLKLNSKQLQELLKYSKKIAKKYGASKIFENGFEFGKSLRLRTEKEE